MRKKKTVPGGRDLLSAIRSPEDVKRLPKEELSSLVEALREEILRSVSENGGHLSSNLGMAEATVALHRVFDCPRDTILFDVGHQAYAHKLLTGRWERFGTLRQSGGLSGFTNPEESEYDAAYAGHSGTAVSAGIGIATAKRLAGDPGWVVAVVGDGSFTNGVVYEALNQLSGSGLHMIILLNDNEMSISRNVGGLSRYLGYIRTSERYFTFKTVMKRIFRPIPLIGPPLIRLFGRLRDFLKRVTGGMTWFESFGLEYIGPVDGNNVKKLTSVLEEAKQKTEPVVVHMKTRKGNGYPPAEQSPDRFHSVGPFDPDTGETKKPYPASVFVSTVSDWILRRGGEDKKVCAITAAMTCGCGLSAFAETYPERFFDVGIAEEHAAAAAGGLALAGFKPYLTLYSTFAQRIYDQLWHDVVLQKAHVVLLLSHAGLVSGDGVTHQGLCDVSLMTSLDGTSVWSPDTAEALRHALDAATVAEGLAVVRYPKGKEASYSVSFEENEGWKTALVGSGTGTPLTAVTYGRIGGNVAAAAEEIGRPVRLIVLEKIWPLPSDELFRRMMTGPVAVVEESIRNGGIGEKLALAFPAASIRVRALGSPYQPCGDLGFLEQRNGLGVADLAAFLSDAAKNIE